MNDRKITFQYQCIVSGKIHHIDFNYDHEKSLECNLPNLLQAILLKESIRFFAQFPFIKKMARAGDYPFHFLNDDDITMIYQFYAIAPVDQTAMLA